MRRAALMLGLAAVVAAVASAASDSPATRQAAPAPVTPSAPTTVPTAGAPPMTAPSAATFTVGNLDLRAVRVAPELPAATRDAVTGALDRYLNTAVVAPLRAGRLDADLATVFTTPALNRMAGQDRAALIDDLLPPLDEVTVGTASADLTALLGPDGVAALSADIHIVVTGRLPAGPVIIERTGALQLSADGDTWKVSGYDISVTRRTP